MAMKSPPHPGQGLKDDIDSLGLSIADAALGLGVTRQQLYNVVNGKSAITPDMAVRLEQAIGSTAEGWLRLQTAYDLVQARTRTSELRLKKLVPRMV